MGRSKSGQGKPVCPDHVQTVRWSWGRRYMQSIGSGCFEEGDSGPVRIVDQERRCFLMLFWLPLIPHPSVGFCLGNCVLLSGSVQSTWFRVRRNCPLALRTP